MGRAVRERPACLAEKLLYIRTALGLSQNGMIRRMGMADQIVQADISTYESDQREPPLKILLAYARAANVSVEALIDDELGLPEELPCRRKCQGIVKPLKAGVRSRTASLSSRVNAAKRKR